MRLADLVRAQEQGLDLNRLIFARYLVLTKRLTEESGATDETMDQAFSGLISVNKEQTPTVGSNSVHLLEATRFPIPPSGVATWNRNRLLFVKYLIKTKRLNDDLPLLAPLEEVRGLFARYLIRMGKLSEWTPTSPTTIKS